MLANGLWFIWSNRFIPSADYPDWLYQGFLLSRVLRGEGLSGYSLHHYPVPNSIPTIVMGFGDLMMPPEIVGKLLTSAVLILFAVASIYLIKSLNPSEGNPALYVPLLLLFNCWFFFGELSYLIGLGLLFIYGGYLVRRLDAPHPVPASVIVASLLALFLAHPIPYVVAAMVSGLFVWKSRSRRLATRFLIAGAPSVGLLCWYLAGRLSNSSVGAGATWQFWTWHQIGGRVVMAFSPFQEFLPWLGIAQPGMHLAAAINLVTSLALCGSIVACVISLCWRWSAFVPLAVACCLAGFIGAGYAVMGWVGPGERFIYPAAWFTLCWLGVASMGREGTLAMRALKAGLAVLLVAQAVCLDTGVAMVSRRLADLDARMNATASRSESCAIYEDAVRQGQPTAHRQGLDRFLNNVPSVLRLPYYGYLARGADAPIFQVGLFSYDGPGNNENLCE